MKTILTLMKISEIMMKWLVLSQSSAYRLVDTNPCQADSTEVSGRNGRQTILTFTIRRQGDLLQKRGRDRSKYPLRISKDNSNNNQQIPALQAHCKKLTESSRASTCRRFLNSISQLTNSLGLWASNEYVLLRYSMWAKS